MEYNQWKSRIILVTHTKKKSNGKLITYLIVLRRQNVFYKVLAQKRRKKNPSLQYQANQATGTDTRTHKKTNSKRVTARGGKKKTQFKSRGSLCSCLMRIFRLQSCMCRGRGKQENRTHKEISKSPLKR